MSETIAENSEQSSRKGFGFTGNAKDYFGIWIVNLLLSIVTLGIYTAWAKVRRLRYFYGNTWLDGHNFEYHAKPMQILIGRVIVLGVLIIVNILANFVPIVALLLMVPYFLALPWLINKALSFNARMTSYRNVRLGFDGSYKKAFWVFVIAPLIVPVVAVVLGFIVYQVAFASDPFPLPTEVGLTLTPVAVLAVLAQCLIWPYLSKLTAQYIGNATRFGTARFSTNPELKPFYRNFAVCLLPAILGVVAIPAVSVLALTGELGPQATEFAIGLGQAIVIFVYVAFVLGFLGYSAGVRNIAYNATRLEGGHRMQSSLSRRRYVWIMVSNLFVSVVTLGLMIPWASVRRWNYLADNTAVNVSDSLDNFVAAQEAGGNVAAAEYLDIEGIELGL